MKSTSEMIVDTPAGHLARGQLGHIEEVFIATDMPVAQEIFQVRGIRELGLGAEATVHHIKIVCQSTGRIRENVGRQFTRTRFKAREFLQTLADLLDTLRDFAGATVVGVRDCSQYAWESRTAIAVFRRKIRATVEGLLLRREEHREWPASLARQHLHDALVNVVEIRSLFAVHLDAHKVLIHDSRDALVLEGLVFHDMAPVARGVANREQERFVFSPRFLERFGSPRKPVYRVMGVLE